MKHTSSYIIAGIWIVIALFLGGILVKELVHNDSGWGILSIGNLFNNDFVPTGTETIETSYSEESVKTVDVDVVAASVTMKIGSGRDVAVKIMTNLPEERRPVAKMDGSALEIKTPTLYRNNFSFGKYRTTIEITVPSAFNTSSRAEKRSIILATVSGSLTVDGITAETFDVGSVSGSVKLENVKADSVDCDSVSGSVRVDGNLKKFNIESVSGSIRVKTATMIDSKSSVESVSGSVHISLPENDGFTLDYSSVSGSTENEFTGFKSGSKNKNGKNEYKNGDVKITVGTISGSIHVEKL